MKNAVGREIPEKIGDYVARPYTGAYEGAPSTTPVRSLRCAGRTDGSACHPPSPWQPSPGH